MTKVVTLRIARDRISLLLDPDSPFLELCAFAGYKNPDSNACGNLIAGIGAVRYASRQLFLWIVGTDVYSVVDHVFSCRISLLKVVGLGTK